LIASVGCATPGELSREQRASDGKEGRCARPCVPIERIDPSLPIERSEFLESSDHFEFMVSR
jgi:hypothetical protein